MQNSTSQCIIQYRILCHVAMAKTWLQVQYQYHTVNQDKNIIFLGNEDMR